MRAALQHLTLYEPKLLKTWRICVGSFGNTVAWNNVITLAILKPEMRWIPRLTSWLSKTTRRADQKPWRISPDTANSHPARHRTDTGTVLEGERATGQWEDCGRNQLVSNKLSWTQSGQLAKLVSSIAMFGWEETWLISCWLVYLRCCLSVSMLVFISITFIKYSPKEAFQRCTNDVNSYTVASHQSIPPSNPTSPVGLDAGLGVSCILCP